MSLSLAFWILMLLWFVWTWPGNPVVGAYGPIGGNILLFVLFLLLGWRIFGAPLHG
jgi:hypothetical protein